MEFLKSGTSCGPIRREWEGLILRLSSWRTLRKTKQRDRRMKKL
jgi:hypothetical protein